MKKILIIVDMQKDFVDGALGTAEAQQIVPAVCSKIMEFQGDIIVTLDTHTEDYMSSSEGKKLPVPHCIKGTSGHCLDCNITEVLKGKQYTVIEKPTFGSTYLPELILSLAAQDEFSIELLGLCTDICVVSNALLLKAHFPETEITVDSSLCAGVTPETHQAAVTTMKMCQINVL